MLPSELIVSILDNLPIQSLLAFGATQRSNYQLANSQLKCLKLAVLNRKSHAALAFASCGSEEEDKQYDIYKTTNLIPREARKQGHPALVLKEYVTAQNNIANSVLSQRSLRNLRSLSLIMYDIQSSELSTTIATRLPKLRTLELNFCHPYIHEKSFPSNFWQAAPNGTPAWNAIAGLGKINEQQLQLRNLQVLRISRAGMTSAQLRKMIQSNPGLRELHLSNVTGVDQEFVQWLSNWCQDDGKLEKMSFTNCAALRLHHARDFEWIKRLGGSEVNYLSLLGCSNERRNLVDDLIEGDELGLGRIEKFVSPASDEFHCGLLKRRLTQGGVYVTHINGWTADHFFEDKMQAIEVDPAYLTSGFRL